MGDTQGDGLARIKVVGIGGAGCNAIHRMVKDKVANVHFIAVNTDAQALNRIDCPQKIRLGTNLTKGLGAGGNADVGRQAAEENKEELQEALKDSEMIFIAAGMGGGTGTGASPVIANIAKETGALTVSIVTRPFSFEGIKKQRLAEEGMARLKEKVDTLIAIPNDRLFTVCDQKLALENAFKSADEVLRQGILSITDLITMPGDINLDFADIRSVMTNAGVAFFSIARGSGENRAMEATKVAISSPLLNMSIEGAKGVLFQIMGNNTLTLAEVHAAADLVSKMIDPDAVFKWGWATDTKMENEVKVTIIATGFASREVGFLSPEAELKDFVSSYRATPALPSQPEPPTFLRTTKRLFPASPRYSIS